MVNPPRAFPDYRHCSNIAAMALLLLIYMPLVMHWGEGWLYKTISIEHEYFSHGLLGLPFAAYIAWSQQAQWQQLPQRAHPAGLLLLMGGLVLYFSHLPDAINLSLPIVLTGMCLWFKGRDGLRLQAFPLLLVFLATPNSMPYLLTPYTLPLQRLIAGVAGFMLMQLGVQVRVEQIYLFVNDRIIEVAPYCAGLKMLFTCLYVGLMLVYWTGLWRDRPKTTLFFLGIVSLSVVANILRNTLLAFLHGTGQAQAFHWLHESWGGDVYSAGLLAMVVLLLRSIEHWPIQRVRTLE